MSIRANTNRKDHLRAKGPMLSIVEEPLVSEVLDPLRFWTVHPTKPCLVDLAVFDSGQLEARGRSKRWNGPFSGRPALIAEMIPVIRDHLMPLTEKSVAQFMNALRAWWRLFDVLDAEMPDAPSPTSTAQLTELHRQRALAQGMDRLIFGNFLLLVNKTRVALGLKPLYWQRPEARNPTRHLAPEWQTELVRHELKHRWFAILDRWELADKLLREGTPLVATECASTRHTEQDHLLKTYQRLENAIEKTGLARPPGKDLYGDDSKDQFYKEYSLLEALRGRYPDGDDIRVAFHLCLANTGWNSAVFLDLNVNESFIEPHPKDAARYILRGIKDRAGGNEQVTEGLFKTRGGPAFVLQTLIARTAPLREQIAKELQGCQEQLKQGAQLELEKRIALEERIAALETGLRSPWLYVSAVGDGLHWLAGDSVRGKAFLSDVIADINRRQPVDRQLSDMKASDLRDAYAARVYHASGGSILAVKKALNHRRLSSTRDYLDNSLLREEHRKLYITFSTAMWEEIRIYRRVDPTILAMWSRHGEVGQEHYRRLETYRNLMRSRIRVGCKDPKNPPKHIAPQFQPDGEAICPVQRCLLCIEHAVIFPDSLDGLCKRLAELLYLQANMSATAFTQSSFGEEMENIELALLGFDQPSVKQHTQEWVSRIADGSHRVIEFDGVEA